MRKISISLCRLSFNDELIPQLKTIAEKLPAGNILHLLPVSMVWQPRLQQSG
jgi:hypothetical protein